MLKYVTREKHLFYLVISKPTLICYVQRLLSIGIYQACYSDRHKEFDHIIKFLEKISQILKYPLYKKL